VPVNGRDPADGPLLFLPELLLEVAASLKLRAPTEAGLAELPPSELEVLRLISIFPGCGISFLTEQTKMRQANTSSTVRSLVQRGLVTKEPGEHDRRAVRLTPTPQASRDLELLRRVWLDRLLRAFEAANMSEGSRIELLRTLSAVRDGLRPRESGP